MAKTIMVGLSGGVDSAVCCKLLIDQGLKVEAMFMKNWEEDDNEQCSAEQDLKDATQVATQLDIKLHTVNFSHEYWERVFINFLNEYKKGRTPNPDVLCNREIKFKAFLDHAKTLGADKIATGHYAQIIQQDGMFKLMKGLDKGKDQSYFLHLLNQQQLASSLFPLGSYQKDEIRKIAKQAGFDNFAKKDSTGICFIGERNFKNFLSEYLSEQTGDIINTDGTKIGQHQGLMYYTLGQRKGLEIGGLKDFAEGSWYVVDKNLESNQLVVSQDNQHPLLMADKVWVETPHFIGKIPKLPLVAKCKIRYRQNDVLCAIESLNKKEMIVTLGSPQAAVTPGQSLVIYNGEECLGGGVIKHKELT